MKGKLIKTDDGYILEGNNLPNPRRLSLKNCEAIELGYDLDELAKLEAEKRHNWDDHEDIDIYNDLIREDSELIKIGIQKSHEILGDKKFSEDDMKKAIHFGASWRDDLLNGNKKVNELFESLQQNEWQVEVITDRIPADLAPGGWDEFPKLDEQNCLILKK